MTWISWAACCLSISTRADSVISFTALTNIGKVAERYHWEEEQEKRKRKKKVLQMDSTEITVMLRYTTPHGSTSLRCRHIYRQSVPRRVLSLRQVTRVKGADAWRLSQGLKNSVNRSSLPHRLAQAEELTVKKATRAHHWHLFCHEDYSTSLSNFFSELQHNMYLCGGEFIIQSQKIGIVGYFTETFWQFLAIFTVP